MLFSGCSTLESAFSPNGNIGTIEIVKIDDGKDSVVILKAILKVPVGTVISDQSPDINSTRKTTNEYLLISEMHPLNPFPESYDEGLPIIDTSFNGPFYRTAYGIKTIGTATPPYKPIESYADYAKPGIYNIKKGQKFRIAKINDSEYAVTIIDFP